MFRSPLIKTLVGLTVLLAVLVGLYFYLQVPSRETPFLKAAGKATGVLLTQGNDRVNLLQDGKVWKVMTRSGAKYPANAEKVKTLLSGLQDLQVEDEISEGRDGTPYDLGPTTAFRVGLTETGSSLMVGGDFGKQAPDFTHIYFRFPNRPAIYLARNLIRGELGETDVNSWRDKTLVDMPEAKVQSVIIEGRGFKTSLERSSDTWTLSGRKIDPAPVYQLLGALAHLKADDFVDPSSATLYGYENLHWARITAKTNDRTVELRIGAEDKQAKRYPVAAAPDTGPVWLSEIHLKPLLLKPSDFK